VKKYILLSIFGIVVLGALVFFYTHSESQLVHGHQDTLKTLTRAKQMDASLEKNLLRLRNFLLQNYDEITSDSDEIDNICKTLRESHMILGSHMTAQLSEAIENYCDRLEKRVSNIEIFKSKNAIYRNSLYFLQRAASDQILSQKNAIKFEEENLRTKLIESSLAYALISTSEAKVALTTSVAQVEKYLKIKKPKSDLHVLILHSTHLFSAKENLDSLTHEIVMSDSDKLLNRLHESYFHIYTKAQDSATIHRRLLFATGTLFLLLIFYSVIQFWKTALTKANENLEERVQKRTVELQESQSVILGQQQAMISAAKLSALGEMAAGVAHEINTPLAVISLRVEQLEESIKNNEDDPEKLLKMLDAVKATTGRIAKIINGLRFFAREGRTLKAQVISVTDLINETLNLCKERFANHGIDLNVIIPNENQSLKIECRSVEISQVLLSLLNNSYDAIEGLPKKWVNIEVKKSGEYAEISISDSGAGINPVVQEKLMQPFFTTKPVGKGTGLGLSISRGLIESHHGKLYYDKNSSHTKFVILVPQMKSAA